MERIEAEVKKNEAVLLSESYTQAWALIGRIMPKLSTPWILSTQEIDNLIDSLSDYGIMADNAKFEPFRGAGLLHHAINQASEVLANYVAEWRYDEVDSLGLKNKDWYDDIVRDKPLHDNNQEESPAMINSHQNPSDSGPGRLFSLTFPKRV